MVAFSERLWSRVCEVIDSVGCLNVSVDISGAPLAYRSENGALRIATPVEVPGKPCGAGSSTQVDSMSRWPQTRTAGVPRVTRER
jgi:hypothetical protein